MWIVVERFRSGGPREVGERFGTLGRMLPDGLEYVASWMTPDGGPCYQIMRGTHASLLQAWMDRWSDLVAFEATEIVPSDLFWAAFPR